MVSLFSRLTKKSKSKPSKLDDLTRIAIKNGTDKFGAHLYTPIYDKLFAPLRLKPVKLLEIGVGGYGAPLAGGLGLAAWAEYFPNGQIVGLDIEEKRLGEKARIKVVQGSQDDPSTLDKLWREHGPFDIIIDDGSHLPHHVMVSFRHLYPLMGEAGIYVIEDTQTSFWPDLGGRPDGRNSIFEVAFNVGIAMHAEEVRAGGAEPVSREFGLVTKSVQICRNLIIFERGSNSYPSNHTFDASHPEVVAVRDAITAEAERHPSPGAYLTSIDMEMWAQRREKAIVLARQAMENYQDRVDVLAYAYGVFERCNQPEDCLRAAEGLVRLSPNDPWAQHVATHYRSVCSSSH